MVNQEAQIVFEDSNGEVNEIMEEELPYDLKQDVIELDEEGFAIWYMDSLDHPKRYDGKTVRFMAQVLKPEKFPKGYFVPGRMAMTCCADDMAFLGFACEYAGTDSLTNKQWVMVTASITIQYFEDYKGEGPVLHAKEVTSCKAPKNEVLSFV